MRLSFIIIAFIFFSYTSNAQNNGFLVTIHGDTLRGIIKTINYDFAFEDQLDFEVETEDGKSLKLINQLVTEYAIQQSDPTGQVEWVHYYAQIKKYTREFLVPYMNGRARLYADFKSAFYTGQVPTQENHRNRNLVYYLALAGEEQLVLLSKNNFIDITKAKFQNCPELVKQIGNKYFQFNDIEGIVTYYNRLCR